MKKQIVVFGESGVGKTCFCDMVTHQAPFVYHHATASEAQQKKIVVGDTAYYLNLLDVNSTIFRERDPTLQMNYFNKWLQDADGVVLLFDLTSKATFDHIVNDGHLTMCMNRKTHNAQGKPYMCGGQRFGCVLVGTKADLATENRAVSRELAEEWAQTQGISYIELDKDKPDLIEKAMEDLVSSIIHAERRDAEDMDKTNKDERKTQKKSGDRMSSLTQSFRTAFRRQSHTT